MEQRSAGARWAREKRTSHLTRGLVEGLQTQQLLLIGNLGIINGWVASISLFIVFQDIFRLFDKSDNVTLDGKDLFGILKEQGIAVTDNLVDEVLTILNNHGIDIPPCMQLS